MAPDDHSGAKPAGPVVLRIKLRYDDLDAMVQRFAANVGKSGLFLPTKSMQPLGTEVKFERRRQLGLPDVAIPLPEDVESARRADMDSQPRADTSGIVREAMAQMASAPVAEQILTARPTTGPVGTVKEPVLESGPVVAPSG